MALFNVLTCSMATPSLSDTGFCRRTWSSPACYNKTIFSSSLFAVLWPEVAEAQANTVLSTHLRGSDLEHSLSWEWQCQTRQARFIGNSPTKANPCLFFSFFASGLCRPLRPASETTWYSPGKTSAWWDIRANLGQVYLGVWSKCVLWPLAFGLSVY